MAQLVFIETDVQDAIAWLRVKRGDLPGIFTSAGNEVARKIKVDLQSTTKQWSHKPEFQTVVETSSNGFAVLAGTDDAVWNMLDVGTPEHFIFPKSAGGTLVFQWGGPGSYHPKSIPGWIGSQPGGPSGATVFRKYVLHPGTAPREWAQIITDKWETQGPDILRGYLQRWAY